MQTIVSGLPYVTRSVRIDTSRGVSVQFYARQIPLFVCVGERSEPQPATDAVVFPAVLDTGFNRDFLCQESHLSELAGIRASGLDWVDAAWVYANRALGEAADAKVVAANVWLFGNVPGKRALSRGLAIRLDVDPGIHVILDASQPNDAQYRRPRVPLLGLHALERAGLRVIIDTKQRTVDIEAPD
ncbi:MAG: hypothetical protein HYS13_05580 [Planctomycetia bacterium]|nr:hypothetical protein [Planctomycetia bacterium]